MYEVKLACGQSAMGSKVKVHWDYMKNTNGIVAPVFDCSLIP